MTTTLFYINSNLVNPPKNAAELALQLNYGSDQFPNAGVISITDFIWVRENYDLLIGYINAGLNSTGVGITEGPAFRIDITDGITTQTVFDGYFNFKGAKIKDKISITCKAISHATVDWINEVASGFTFEYLASLPAGSQGAIDPSFYVFVPYVLNQIPNYEQAAIATLTIFAMEQAIQKAITDILNQTADIAGVLNSIAGIIKLIAEIIYTIFLMASLVAALENVWKFLVGNVKYHAGMYVRDLMERACTYLNMQFSSDIWAVGTSYYNEIIIPKKTFNPVSPQDSQLLGFLVPDSNSQEGWFKGTFADLLNALKIKYNAKIVVTTPTGGANPNNQGTVMFLRRDKNAHPPQFTLPAIYNPDYELNVDESKANYLLQFQTDTQDLNTFQNYKGTLYQVITSQKVTNYQPFVALTDLVVSDIPFARATTKTSLTVPEQIINDFLIAFDVIDAVLVNTVNAGVSALNAILGIIKGFIKALRFIGIKVKLNVPTIQYLHKSDLSALITNRIGMMVLANDHFSVDKILCISPGSQAKYTKMDPNNDSLESAQTMWDNYHYVNSIVPKQLYPAYSDRPYGNQYKIQDYSRVPFTWKNLLQIIANNQIYYKDGVTPALIESIKFKPPMQGGSSGQAEIKMRISYIWTLNLTQTFLNPDGR